MTKQEFIEKAKECGYSKKDIMEMVLLTEKTGTSYEFEAELLLNKIDEGE